MPPDFGSTPPLPSRCSRATAQDPFDCASATLQAARRTYTQKLGPITVFVAKVLRQRGKRSIISAERQSPHPRSGYNGRSAVLRGAQGSRRTLGRPSRGR